MVAISHYSTKENYTRSVSLYRLAINLGFSVGPAVGGLLAAINYNLIFWADGITCILAGLCVFFFLTNAKSNHTNEHSSENKEEKKAPLSKSDSPYRDKAYLFFVPMVCIYAIAFFQLFTTMSLYYKNEEMLSEAQIGIVLALNGLLVAAIEMIMIYKIEKKRTVYFWIFIGALLLLLTYVMLIFVHGFIWMIILTFIISFSEMFAMPFMNTFMNQRAAAHNKGAYASLYVMAWSVAQIATPLISTQVFEHFGYRALWVVLAGFCLIVMLLNRQMQIYATK
jgi:MFS family permease